MITRKISKLIRGNTTPMQIMLATVLGSMLGFIPGFGQGAGLIVLLVILLVILNANLFVATNRVLPVPQRIGTRQNFILSDMGENPP